MNRYPSPGLEYERKIDFDIVDQERSKYIDFLSKKLSKQEMTELVTQSIKFKKGHIKAVDFYSYLRDLAKEHDIPMVQEYPNLFYYYIYTKLYDGIDNEGLFKELDMVERRLKKKLFKGEEQEKLDKYSDMLDMFIALTNIELTNEDYELFKGYSEAFTLDDVISFMERLCNSYNLNYVLDGVPVQVSENIPNMIDFYEIAMARDNALISNTLKQMEKEGTNRCVLIAGGFHTKGIKNILERKGVSYAVVTPKITKDVETPYIKVLTNQRTSLEDIITESAAMPGMSKIMADKEGAQPESKMMAPFPRGFLASIKFEDPAEFDAFAEQIDKAVRGIEGSRTTGKTTDDVWKPMLKAALESLAKEWGQANPEVLKEAISDIDNKIIKPFTARFISELSKIIGKKLPAETEAQIADVIAKQIRGSVGENSVDVGARTTLFAEKFILYDEILRQDFEGVDKFKDGRGHIEGRSGLKVLIHEGQEERIARENDRRLQNGEPTIPSARVHPGTWGGKQNQIHVSATIWKLSDDAKKIIANHEQVHFDIYNAKLGRKTLLSPFAKASTAFS
ncbi:hypothetical protein ACFL5C_02335 [Candidatus Omnitrophota bacterium]